MLEAAQRRRREGADVVVGYVELHGREETERLLIGLEQLPPLQIQVGSRESLLDDARRLADRAGKAGVDVTYVEHPGVIHMWIVFAPTSPARSIWSAGPPLPARPPSWRHPTQVSASTTARSIR